ncbi:MAG: tetraacyldisaccharide-1-P synthase [Wigglesworthia glossinidia]|nr:tetraacyldisaccharide-1-P synthase [Wigglesworthia glossinidia]
MNNKYISIGIVVGEISGDLLGASLIKTLNVLIPNIKFFGIAGPEMLKEKNVESWYSIKELSIIGITEIIWKIPKILKIRKALIKRFFNLKPHLFIGIDAPEFNLDLALALKQKGIKTMHYIGPSIWAWRKNRILKIKKAVDKILTILPFEKKIYDYFNISCDFIGHPLADKIPMHPNKSKMRSSLGISKYMPCLALLPGSRIVEINLLSARFLDAAKIIKYHFPNLQVLVPMANDFLKQKFISIQSKIAPNLSIFISNESSYKILACSDAAIVASGTATLECMFAKCPMVVGYYMKALNFMLLKRLVYTKWISLPNLIAKKLIVSEKIQQDCCPEILAKEILPFFKNQKKTKKLKNIFYKLHRKMRCNADYKAANSVLDLLKDICKT